MTVIERLEALAEKAQPRPWRVAPEGKPQNTILTDDPGQSADPRGDESYYGGHIVAESIVRPDREFIVAVVNALPDLLKLVRATDALAAIDCELLPEGVVAGLGNSGCAFCTLRTARESLFREVQP